MEEMLKAMEESLNEFWHKREKRIARNKAFAHDSNYQQDCDLSL